MNNEIKTLYCGECKKDIPVEELENGSVVVHCPKCVGECLICHCHLVDECFPESPNVRVRHPDDGQEQTV